LRNEKGFILASIRQAEQELCVLESLAGLAEREFAQARSANTWVKCLTTASCGNKIAAGSSSS